MIYELHARIVTSRRTTRYDQRLLRLEQLWKGTAIWNFARLIHARKCPGTIIGTVVGRLLKVKGESTQSSAPSATRIDVVVCYFMKTACSERTECLSLSYKRVKISLSDACRIYDAYFFRMPPQLRRSMVEEPTQLSLSSTSRYLSTFSGRTEIADDFAIPTIEEERAVPTLLSIRHSGELS